MKNQLASLVLILLTAMGFYELVISDIFSIGKFLIAVLLLIACSFALQKFLKIEGDYGLLLVRTKKGLKFLEKVANLNPDFWRTFTEFGTVLGFGLLSIFIFKRIHKWTFILSMIGLLIFSQFILPFSAPLVLELINLPTSSQSIGLSSAAAAGAGYDLLALISVSISYLVFLSLIVGGLALAGVIGILLKAFTILLAIALFITSAANGASNSQILAQEGPGAAPVLPGINLPFFEGILALLVLLVVHESAHGILARVEKIPLKSAGVVFVGILPFGAFVDPDEKILQKTEREKQNRVLVAGSTANLVTAIMFFFILLLFQYWVVSAYPTQKIGMTYVEITGVAAGSPAYGFLKEGMRIIDWQCVPINHVSDFRSAANDTRKGEAVIVTTDAGRFVLRAGTGGKVGVSVLEKTYTFADWIRELASRGMGWLSFLFNFLALAFVLNILVGIVNLLPIPAFDGFRIIALTIKKKKIFGAQLMDVIMALIVGAFLANLLPWLWT